jgi:hypothetical protein
MKKLIGELNDIMADKADEFTKLNTLNEQLGNKRFVLPGLSHYITSFTL